MPLPAEEDVISRTEVSGEEERGRQPATTGEENIFGPVSGEGGEMAEEEEEFM